MLPAAVGCLVLATGCSVIDEIDNIGKDSKSSKTAAKKSGSGETELPSAAEGSNRAKLRKYYNRKPAESVEEDPNNPIVRCELRAGTQFMRKHDCTLRGGHALS